MKAAVGVIHASAGTWAPYLAVDQTRVQATGVGAAVPLNNRQVIGARLSPRSARTQFICNPILTSSRRQGSTAAPASTVNSPRANGLERRHHVEQNCVPARARSRSPPLPRQGTAVGARRGHGIELSATAMIRGTATISGFRGRRIRLAVGLVMAARRAAHRADRAAKRRSRPSTVWRRGLHLAVVERRRRWHRSGTAILPTSCNVAEVVLLELFDRQPHVLGERGAQPHGARDGVRRRSPRRAVTCRRTGASGRRRGGRSRRVGERAGEKLHAALVAAGEPTAPHRVEQLQHAMTRRAPPAARRGAGWRWDESPRQRRPATTSLIGGLAGAHTADDALADRHAVRMSCGSAAHDAEKGSWRSRELQIELVSAWQTSSALRSARVEHPLEIGGRPAPPRSPSASRTPPGGAGGPARRACGESLAGAQTATDQGHWPWSVHFDDGEPGRAVVKNSGRSRRRSGTRSRRPRTSTAGRSPSSFPGPGSRR